MDTLHLGYPHHGKTLIPPMSRLFILIVAFSLSTPVEAQELVAEINTTPVGIRPAYLQAFGSGMVFQAELPETGRTLWISDGTSGGTISAIDLVEGPEDMRFDRLTTWNDQLLFWESTLEAMFVSDGTQANTRSLTGFWNTGRPAEVLATRQAAFIHLTSTLPDELRYTLPGADVTWKVDYTCSDQLCRVYDPFVFRDSLYFNVIDQSEHWIWRVGLDGQNPEPVEGPFMDWLGFEGIVEDRVLFIHRNELRQWSLYSWLPGESLSPLIILAETDTGLDFGVFGNAGGHALMFLAPYSGPDQWLTTDGTRDGTRVLRENAEQSWPGNAKAHLPDGTLVFDSWSQETGSELWVSDGTVEGTRMVTEILPGPAGSNPSNFVLLDDEVYFGAVDESHNRELWKTDGTSNGTALVADINPGPANGAVAWLVAQDDQLYFRGRTPDWGYQIMRYDPSSDQVSAVTSANTQSSFGSHPEDFVVLPERTVFSAFNPQLDSRSLWTTDGTSASTRLVHVPGLADQEAHGTFLGNVQGKTVWRGANKLIVLEEATGQWWSIPLSAGWGYGDEGVVITDEGIAFGPQVIEGRTGEIWFTDGKEAGTSVLYSPPVGDRAAPVAKADDAWLIAEEGRLLALRDGVTNILIEDPDLTWRTKAVTAGAHTYIHVLDRYGMWATDGTDSGTVRLGNGAYLTAGYAVIDGDLLYQDRTSGTAGRELVRRSHPDTAWTVVDLYPGVSNSNPATIRQWNDKALFTAHTDRSGRQVWISDGTSEGTHALITDLEGAGLDDWTARLFFLGGDEENALFSVGHGSFGREPWFTNGRQEGTHLLADIIPGPTGSDPTEGGLAGNMILFDAAMESTGPELWGVSLSYLATDVEPIPVASTGPELSLGYPNPTRSVIHFSWTSLQGSPANIHVIDILGRRHHVPVAVGSDLITLDVHRLPPGLYFAQVESDSRTSSRRFIKRR